MEIKSDSKLVVIMNDDGYVLKNPHMWSIVTLCDHPSPILPVTLNLSDIDVE